MDVAFVLCLLHIDYIIWYVSIATLHNLLSLSIPSSGMTQLERFSREYLC